MTIKRLTENLELDTGDRFILFYGQVNDEFCDDDLRFGNIDLMLWRFFHARGYQRIVFYEGAQKIYWLDAESERLCRGGQQSASPQGPTAATTGGGRIQGPLGKKNLMRKVAPPGSPASVPPLSQPASTGRRSMTDLSSIEIIHHILSSQKDCIPTVVVFTHADDINQAHFEGRSFRDFQNRLVQWARASSQGLANLCAFIFQETSRENILERCKRNELTALTNTVEGKGEEGQNVIHVGGPDKQELLNVIHYHRLVNQMIVDWCRLDRLVIWCAAEGRALSFWRGKLARASSFSREAIITWLPGERTYTDKSAEEQLSELIGLAAVKDQIKKKLAVARKLGGGHAGSLHMAFLGYPGTGKTVVAGLVGEIFREAGLLQRGHTVVAGRAELVGEYEGHSAVKTNGLIDRALDGVLFIDEAHQLIREGANDPFGMEAMGTLVPKMEGKRDRLCVILAGYKKQIRRLIAQDDGLKSRVKDEIIFDDYSPAELVGIFRLMAKKKEAEGLPPVAPEAMASVEKILKGMYETRNPEDWGNAREVRNFLDDFYASWAVRSESRGGEERLLAEDIPEKYRDFVEIQLDVDALLAELNSLTGLAPVKTFVQGLVQTVNHGKQREAAGLPKAKRQLRHMLFKGNPGTGKTTVARLMGKIFKGLGILPRGHVIAVTGGDLVGAVVGGGLDKTKEKIREAIGGVLFIDEIYGLAEGSLGETYGPDVINNVLVPAMTEHMDRLVVVGAGYTQAIERFLNKNEGLSSRFRHQVEFPDFTAEELLAILDRYAEGDNYRISSDCRDALAGAFKALVESRPKDFGNARDVEKYFGDMLSNIATRTSSSNLPNPTKDDLCTFTKEDLPDTLKKLISVDGHEDLESVLAEIEGMVGLGAVKEFVRKQVAVLKSQKRLMDLGHPSQIDRTLHMVFTGNPGTGKTTVARMMGKIFKALGILKKGDCVETDRSDLVAEYSGQSAPKTKAKVVEALDGVLFIDEAYTLSQGGSQDSFGKEVIEQLVTLIDDYRDCLIVIVAGYPEKMKKFIGTNPGLKSRFTQYVSFDDYSPSELEEIFLKICSKNKYRLSSEAQSKLKTVIHALWVDRGSDFGNGREMRNLFQKVYENLSLRIAVLDNASEEQCFTIHPADIPGIGQDVVTSPTPSSFSKARRLLSMSDIPFTPSAIIEDNEKGAGAMGNLRLVLPAVGFVEVMEANGNSGTGSGFVITPDGKFLTCYHVTENAQSLRVRFDNDPHKYYEAVYLDGDRDADIALLQLSSGSFDHALLILSGEEVQLGDEVGLLGYPLGTDLGTQVTYTKGVISSFRKTEDDAMLYQIDANAYPGSSGGPLFRQSDGRVVGILKGGFQEERAPGINFAVSVQELFRRLVKEVPVEAMIFDNQ